MDLTNDTIGISSFGRTATLNQELTHNANAAKNAINNLTASGYTNTGEGIRVAQQEIITNGSSDAFPIILLFTDGLPSAHSPNGYSCQTCPTENNTCTNYARQQANNSKDDNTTIFSIGFTGAILNYGCTNASITFAEWLLKDIASIDEYYYRAPNATDLEKIYQNISHKIYNATIFDLIITDFLPSHFLITNDGGGNYSVLPNGTHKIEFTRSFLALNDSWDVNFRITTHVVGDLLLTNFAHSNLNYTQENNSYTEYLPYPIYINVTSPLEIEKNAPIEINQNGQFNYSINITNIGHMALSNVSITDPLSNKVIFNSIDSNYSGFGEDNWEYNEHIVNITNILLDIGDKIGFDISVTAKEGALGSINNTASGGYTTSTGCTVKDICNSSVSTYINNPPVAVDDTATTPEDTAVWIDVLDNDYDIDGTLDPSTVTVTSDPSNGSTIVNTTTGEIQYTPDTNFHGSDSFTYTVDDNDGATSNEATVNITVGDVNDPPNTPNKPAGSITIKKGKSSSYSTNTTDPDIGDQVRFRFDWGDGTISTWTDWVNSSQSASKTKSWTKGGIYNVKAQAEDTHGALSNWSSSLQVTVSSGGSGNQPPIAIDDSASTNIETAVWIDVLDNDDDIDGTLDPSTVTITSGPSNGNTTINIITGEVKYKPNADFNDSDGFTYTVDDNDGATSNEATVTIIVGGGVKADASAGSPYFGFVGENITFDGSLSYDPDPEGYIVSWYWDFGDGMNGTGETTSHVYEEVGNYTAILTVTDDINITDQDKFTVVIIIPNIPPTPPFVDGPTSGAINTVYNFTAVSTDADNDTIRYVFDWGDNSNLTISNFIPNGTMTIQKHSWKDAGHYIISVYANDKKTDSISTEYIVYIDVTVVGDLGYLTDDDGDGIFDMFHDGKNIHTELGIENNTYLIDSDGDGKWDHVFTQENEVLTYTHFVVHKYVQIYEERKSSGFEILLFFAMLVLVIIIMRRKR
jgi:uncharacterized repeat protein (TIGR01451 family)